MVNMLPYRTIFVKRCILLVLRGHGKGDTQDAIKFFKVKREWEKQKGKRKKGFYEKDFIRWAHNYYESKRSM